MRNVSEIDRCVVTGGVDTHKDFHVAAVLSASGRVLGTGQFPASADGYVALHAWLVGFGELDRVGIEGTSSFGKNLTRHLQAVGVVVCEVIPQNRQRRRRTGKSDPADAVAAAKQVQAGEAEIVPKADGVAEQIRVIRLCRKGFVRSRTKTANQIHAIVDTAPEHIRTVMLAAKKVHKMCAVIVGWPTVEAIDNVDDAVRFALANLAGEWLQLSERIADCDRRLRPLVTAATPPALLAECGIATETAGAIAVAFGSNPERVRTEAGFAALGGVSPVDASSGRHIRHRLNRGGNRDLNNALWQIIIVRLRYHEPTRTYMARKLAQGKTKKEVIRCLKRHLARHIWRTITAEQRSQATQLAA